MPKELEQKLKRKAAKKFPRDKERQNAYVYGTLRDTGWKPKREKHHSAPSGSWLDKRMKEAGLA